MATYDSLSVEEKALITTADTFIRGFLRQMGPSTLDLKLQWYVDNVTPIIATLDASEIIPNSTGLAGATDLTHEQLTTLKNWINQISTDVETNKSLLVKAIGVNA